LSGRGTQILLQASTYIQIAAVAVVVAVVVVGDLTGSHMRPPPATPLMVDPSGLALASSDNDNMPSNMSEFCSSFMII
jgi:hypothetical protein